MNKEFIWQANTPLHTKLCVYFGALTSYMMAALYLLGFATALSKLPNFIDKPDTVTLSLFSPTPQDFNIAFLLKRCMIVCAIGCFIHLTCGYGIYKFRTFKFPISLIVLYLFIENRCYFLHTPVALRIFIFLLFSWIVSIGGSFKFLLIKKSYIELQNNKDYDPYGLHSSASAANLFHNKTSMPLPPSGPIKVDFHNRIEEEDENDEPRAFF